MSTSCSGLISKYAECIRKTPCYMVGGALIPQGCVCMCSPCSTMRHHASAPCSVRARGWVQRSAPSAPCQQLAHGRGPACALCRQATPRPLSLLSPRKHCSRAGCVHLTHNLSLMPCPWSHIQEEVQQEGEEEGLKLRKCMKENPPECETFRFALFQCKRGQADARTRIQGNKGY
jgi:hypothetical protein